VLYVRTDTIHSRNQQAMTSIPAAPVPSSGPSAQADDLLVQRIQAGETRLFDDLFHRFFPRVFRFAAILCGSPTDAQDIAQEAFIRAFRALPTYQPRGKLVNWLLTITRNLVLTWFRKPPRERADSELLEQVPDVGADARWGNEPMMLMDSEFLKVLKPSEREVLLLRVVEELSYDEIAVITGQTANALRKIVCRALARVRGEHAGPDETAAGPSTP